MFILVAMFCVVSCVLLCLHINLFYLVYDGLLPVVSFTALVVLVDTL